MKTNPACAVAFAVLLCLTLPLPVLAWSLNTHLYSAAAIVADMSDDGMLQINEVIRNEDGTFGENPLTPIPVDEDIREAVLAFPDCFYAGSCGPDVYPDIYVGQSIIHPYEPGQHWRAINWAEHVLRYARKYSYGDKRKKAISYAAGFLVHYAGDGFGHTWVNSYAGGCWDWGNMDLVCRHVSVESWVSSLLPWEKFGHDRPPTPDCDPSFLRDALMIHDDVQPSIVRSGFLKALVDYYRGLDRGVDKCNDLIHDEWAWLYGAAEVACILKPYLVDLRDDGDRALYEWGETSSRAMREMSEGNVVKIPIVIDEWIGDWALDLTLGIPSVVENLFHLLGVPMDWISMPIKAKAKELLKWMWESVGAGPFERALNPTVFMEECYTESQRAQVNEDIHLESGGGKVEPDLFKPLYDTIALGKLALSTEEGIESIGTQLGVKIPFSGSKDNIMWYCVSSLDASNQLSLYPKLRLLDTPELKEKAFRHLFKTDPYEQTPSRIDPNHILVAQPMGGRTVWLGTPLPDPGDGSKVVQGYVYGGTGATRKRIPIFTEAVPTTGRTGVYSDLVKSTWEGRADMLTTFHFATSDAAMADSPEAEDTGVDVTINIQEHALPDPMGGEGMDDALAQMMNAGQFAAMMAEMMAKAGQPGAPDPDEIKAQMEAFMAAMAEARANSGTAGMPADADDPLVIPPETVGEFSEMINNPPAIDEDMPEDVQTRLREAQAAMHLVIATLEDAEGNPVPKASVTLVQASLYEALKTKAATGLATVRLDLWCPGAYNMARTNAQGQFAMWGVEEGNFKLVATAAGRPRLEKPLSIYFLGKPGIILPALKFGGSVGGTLAGADADDEGGGMATTASTTGGGGAAPPPPGGGDFGQESLPPRFVIEPQASTVDYSLARSGGGAALKVLLRPLSNFTGPVELSIDGLPEGVTAKFSENPVNLTKAKEVTAVFSAALGAADRAQVVIRATAGDITSEAPVFVALGRGKFVATPARLTLKPGKSAKVRLSWTGSGEAVKLAYTKLPAGLSLKVNTVQWHPEAEQVQLADLTTDKLIAAGETFRDREPALQKHPVVLPPTLTATRIRQAPVMLLQKGVRLAPGGWVEATVSIAPGTKPGKLTIPLKCRVGQWVTDQKLDVTVSR